MPTRGHEGHDPGRPQSTGPHPVPPVRDPEHPGYEVQDVSVGGIITFITGLSGFLVIFFVFCFFMGKAINYTLAKEDGPANKWHAGQTDLGSTPRGEKREDLTSNAVMEQRQLAQMTQTFPTPRLEMDDGDQDIADLHAREDLLLDYYSSSPDLPSGTIRIPIARAMQLVVQQGLPKPPAAAQPAPLMAGETAPIVQAPLTDGFARTGYELDTIEAREQKNEFNRAEANHE
ncbi:MAG TPA: hypothetical protein VFA99_00315 [Acidobacteriaceae bacterium]|nr:hypothetical protein [Acidobacteriaceae bacterium]